MAVSLEDVAIKHDNAKAKAIASALDKATESLLNNGKSPLRKAGQLDNRGSHAYLALYWAEELAKQTDNAELAAEFGPIYDKMAANIDKIIAEIDESQSKPQDIGGYYFPDEEKTSNAMRPSSTLNSILDA